MSNELGNFVLERADESNRRGEHYEFEPWDVEERSPEVLEQMREDGVIDLIDEAPHLFQSGVIYNTDKLAAIFAGNQTGKTKGTLVDLICSCTGEYPHALRVDKGVDTGIKRSINENNIRRFGRRLVSDPDKIIDYDYKRQENTLEWDCGSIIGAGKYPESKRMKTGDVVWVGTLKQARDEHWLPTLKKDIPKHCLDKTKGNNGFSGGSDGRFIVYFKGGIEIHIITYEQGYARFEAAKVPWVILDEEPLDERIFVSVLQRAKRITLVETPYRGKTWSYHRVKNAAKENANIVFYHCTQYDSPYKHPEDIAQARSMIPKWEIESRVYGLHSEQVGKPYFHDLFDTLHSWIKDHVPSAIRYDVQLPANTTPSESPDKKVIARPDRAGLWDVYEEPTLGTSYWMSADTARGDDGGDTRVDANVADVFRHPDPVKNEPAGLPVHVAHCRTVLPTKGFARECLAVAVWYNSSLIAPESKGFSAGTFINEIHGYPYMYTMSVKDDRTRKDVERIGFNTNTKTRQMLFDEIGDYIATHRNDRFSPLKDLSLLKELSTLIVGKGGKPDHASDSTSDSIISFAIGLYVYRFDKWQCDAGGGGKLTSRTIDGTWGGRAVDQTKPPTSRVFGFRR